MAQIKKLQVFVSSTYVDLRDERQAAVEAILTGGHIPAGMELFTAGDESQMEVIKRWIAESDIFLLILGGRYGSLEPQSGKSYVECEYDYAVSLNKPLFACVVKDEAQRERVKHFGLDIVEQENPGLLRAFRQKVTSKMCRFWEDTKDIKLTILETLPDFARREELVGWIRGDEPANTVALAEEVARLAKENTELRQKLLILSTTDTGRREEEYRLALNWDSKTRLRGFDLSHRDLSELTLGGADLAGCDLSNAILQDSFLEQANLTKANLRGAQLTGANLNGANLYRADLTEADLSWANLSNAFLSLATLTNADLSCAILHETKLYRADFNGVDLREANLSRADLSLAKLNGARYNTATQWPNGFDYHKSGAIGPQADLHNADLCNADLHDADLRGANLAGANLTGADLSNADLAGTILVGANLTGANLNRARYNTATQWPNGFDYHKSGAIGSP